MTPPVGVTHYVNVRIWNNASTSTPAPFQQELTVPSSIFSAYERGGLSNVEFFYSNGTIIPSWLEAGNSNAAHASTYWLNLKGGIGAASSVTIYMGFSTKPVMDGRSIGEAPQLTRTYGALDDGANVFTEYSGFAGTVVPSIITGFSIVGGSGGSSSGSVNDGLSFSESCPGAPCPGVQTNFSMPRGAFIASLYETGIAPGTQGWYSNEWAGTATGSFTCSSNGKSFDRVGGEGYWSGYASSPAPPHLGVFSFASNGSTVTAKWYIENRFQTIYGNGASPYDFCSPQTIAGTFTGLFVSAGLGASGVSDTMSVTFQWIQVRAFPPNDVMPAFVVSSSVV